AAFAQLPSAGSESGALLTMPFTVALAAALTETSGQPIDPVDFDLSRLPAHLRLHIVVVDEKGNPVDAGDDLETIRARQASTTRSALAKATPVGERRDIVRWDLGTLARVVEQRVA